MTISPERERQLLASAAYRYDALRAIQFLLTRVRALEKREAELTAAACCAADSMEQNSMSVLMLETARRLRHALKGGRNELAGSP